MQRNTVVFTTISARDWPSWWYGENGSDGKMSESWSNDCVNVDVGGGDGKRKVDCEGEADDDDEGDNDKADCDDDADGSGGNSKIHILWW